MNKRQLEIRSKRHIGTELLWRFKSSLTGHGIEFRDFREYSFWDDAKHIDWIASSKEQRLITRRHDEDRDSTLQLIIDECESLYYEEWYPKLQLKNELISILWRAAISSGMRMKWWKLYKGKRELCYHKSPQVNLEKILLTETSNLRENTQLNLRDFITEKQKKSLCIIISDSLEVDEKSLKWLSLLHDVIYLHISSSFENLLDASWVQQILWVKYLSINLDNDRLKTQYREERARKLKDFRKKLLSYKIRVWLFETGQDPTPELIRTLDIHF